MRRLRISCSVYVVTAGEWHALPSDALGRAGPYASFVARSWRDGYVDAPPRGRPSIRHKPKKSRASSRSGEALKPRDGETCNG